jgi:hypothetical protein
LRTWSTDKDPGYNCAIWEACRATSAAPTLFKRIQIGEPGLEEDFVDAGLGCNNPVQELVQEATREFGEEKDVGCIVSIGAGKPNFTGFKKLSFGFQRGLPLDLIEALASIATDSEIEAAEMRGRFRYCPGLYHRLNMDQGQDIWLEEWEKLSKVKSCTMAYLGDQEINQQVDQIVKALVGRPSHTYKLGSLGIRISYPNLLSLAKIQKVVQRLLVHPNGTIYTLRTGRSVISSPGRKLQMK